MAFMNMSRGLAAERLVTILHREEAIHGARRACGSSVWLVPDATMGEHAAQYMALVIVRQWRIRTAHAGSVRPRTMRWATSTSRPTRQPNPLLR